MSTRQTIMRYIRQQDSRAENVTLFAGRGYFYFATEDKSRPSLADRFTDTGVMTMQLRAMTPEQWLAAFREKADQVRESAIVSRIDAAITSLEERRGEWLFHTTSFTALQEVLRTKKLRPKNADAFVSLSEKPHFGDISGGEVVLVFSKQALRPFGSGSL